MATGGARTVIVTGGTGALGRAVVSAFLDAGEHVVVPWIVEAEARAMPSHPRLSLLEADVADAPGAERVARAAKDAVVLVNGIGGFAGGEPVHAAELEIFDRLMRINLRSAVSACRAVLPGMRAAGRGGAIVNVASRAALDCPAGLAAYSASKAAVIALTRTLAAENADARIRVNAVVPTTIDTPANRAAMPDADFGAWTTPARIASVVRWLCSDEAAAVSGGLIPV